MKRILWTGLMGLALCGQGFALELLTTYTNGAGVVLWTGGMAPVRTNLNELISAFPATSNLAANAAGLYLYVNGTTNHTLISAAIAAGGTGDVTLVQSTNIAASVYSTSNTVFAATLGTAAYESADSFAGVITNEFTVKAPAIDWRVYDATKRRKHYLSLDTWATEEPENYASNSVALKYLPNPEYTTSDMPAMQVTCHTPTSTVWLAYNSGDAGYYSTGATNLTILDGYMRTNGATASDGILVRLHNFVEKTDGTTVTTTTSKTNSAANGRFSLTNACTGVTYNSLKYQKVYVRVASPTISPVTNAVPMWILNVRTELVPDTNMRTLGTFLIDAGATEQ